MPLDWRSAYIKQALSDYDIYLRLDVEGVPACHKLHYLQMATEKLAKGFLTEHGGPRYPSTHKAFARLVTEARHRNDLRTATKITQNAQYRAFIDSLKHSAKKVEDLSPEGGDHPNPEYPWELADVIHSPLEYGFSEVDLKSAEMVRLLKFIDGCIRLAKARG